MSFPAFSSLRCSASCTSPKTALPCSDDDDDDDDDDGDDNEDDDDEGRGESAGGRGRRGDCVSKRMESSRE